MTDRTTAARIRAHLAELTEVQQAHDFSEWLERHLAEFERLGMGRDAVTIALLAATLNRLETDHPDTAAEWLANIGRRLAADRDAAGHA